MVQTFISVVPGSPKFNFERVPNRDEDLVNPGYGISDSTATLTYSRFLLLPMGQ